MREAAVQSATQIAVARTGSLIWRNNSGACEDKNGRIIRYGLGHTSAQQVRSWASSDLIGIVPVTITPEMVGQTLGVFLALEVKKPGWHLTPGDQRAMAQLKFLELVRSVGGIASFVTDPAQVSGIIGR